MSPGATCLKCSKYRGRPYIMTHFFRKTTIDRCPPIFFLQFRVWWLIITYSLIFPRIGNDDPCFQVCLRVYYVTLKCYAILKKKSLSFQLPFAQNLSDLHGFRNRAAESQLTYFRNHTLYTHYILTSLDLSLQTLAGAIFCTYPKVEQEDKF